ncbi:MAG: translocation/assembly module TamB domain-containing protein [Candidatus Eisenbacteria bacterium]
MPGWRGRKVGARLDVDSLRGVLRIGEETSFETLLEGTARLDGKEVLSVSARGSVGGSRFEHEGAYRLGGPLRAEGVLRLTPILWEDLLPLVGGRLDPEGSRGEMTLRFDGSRDSLAFFLEGEGEAGGLSFRTVTASGVLRGDTLRFEEWNSSVNGAAFTGSGFLDLGGRERNVIRLSFDRVDLSRFPAKYGSGLSTDLGGVLDWEGTGRDLTNLEGRITLRLRNSRIENVLLREVEVRGRALRQGLAVEASVIRTAHSELRFSGFVGLDGSFRGNVDGEIPSLGEFRQAAGLDSLGGRADVSAEVAGTPDRFRAVGGALVTGGRVDRVRSREAIFDGWFEKVGGELSGGSKTFVRDASVAGERVDSLRVELRFEDGVLHLDDLSGWRGPWRVQARGSVSDDGARRALAFEDAALWRGDSTWARPGRVLFWEDEKRFRLEPVHFVFGGGQVWVEALRGEDGVVRAALKVEDSDLGVLSSRTGLPPDLLRSVDLDVSASGTGERIEGTVVVHSRPPGSPDLPFLAVDGAARWGESRLTVDSLVFRGMTAESSILVGGTVDLPASSGGGIGALVLEARRFPLEDLGFLTTRLAGAEGELNGRISMTGDLDHPALDASFTVERALVHGYPVGTVRADSVRIRGDSLSFAVRFDPEWGKGNRIGGLLPVRIVPREKVFELPPEGPMEVDFFVPKGDFAFLALLTRRLDEGSGSFRLDAKLRGDRSDPKLGGVFELENGLVFPAGTAAFFDRVTARFLLDEEYVTVVRFESRSGERGRLNAWGRIDLENFRPVTYDVQFKAKEYDLILADGVQLRFDGRLALQPDTTVFRKVVPHFSGEADAKAALVQREFTSDGDGLRTSVLDPTSDPTWTCDIFLRAPGNFWIRNRTFDVEIGGEAQVRRSTQGLGALGQFDVLRGTCWIYNNEFRLREGTVVFTDPDDLRDVQVDVTAHTDVIGERIEVRAFGDADDIQLEPTSQSGYSEGEILSALTLRAAPEQDVNSGQVLSSWFTTLASRLSREMTRGLGDIGTIEIGTSEDLPEIRYGNYLSSDLYLGFSQKVGIGEERADQQRSPTTENLPVPERQLRVEYRLRRSLLIQGEAGTLSDGNRFLNLDLKVRIPY